MALNDAVKRIATAITLSNKNEAPSDEPTGVNEKELLGDLTKMYASIKTARIPFERQWYLNLAFYFGRQYVVWTTQGVAQKLWEPNTPDYRVKLVSNKCKVVVRTETAKMMKERPRGYVVSNTSDDSDKAAARAAGKLYEALEQPGAIGMPLARRHAFFWCSVLGNGFTKQSYNKEKMDFTGTKGSLVIEALSPFSLYVPDLLEPDIENQAYIIHVAAKPIDWVNSMYNVTLQADSSSGVSGGTYDQRFILALGMNQQPKDKNFVTVHEIWMKPCKKYPKGLWALWSQDKLLDYKEGWPYKHAQYPFTKYDSILTGRFYNDSILVDFIPLQKEYNKSISQLLEIRNSMSKPGWKVQKGSVDVNKMTNQPGLIVEYLPGMNPPEQQVPSSVPSYTESLINRIQGDMNDTSGQHDTDHGKTPTGVTAATAISFLQEQDDGKLNSVIQSIEEGAQKTGSQLLSMFSQFCTVERTIKVIGNSDAIEAKQFSAATLKGNTDYRTEFGSAIPRSRAAKQAFILELQERGLPMDQALKYLDMSETNAMYDDTQRDARQADKENLIMAGNKGKPLDINDYDNHLTHIVNHQNFQKTEQFDMLDDKIKKILLDHTTLHMAHVATMYGRVDLLPQAITDPATGAPVLGLDGKPRFAQTNPLLMGFIESVKVNGPPPPPPPMQIGAPTMPGAGNPFGGDTPTGPPQQSAPQQGPPNGQ